MNAKKILGLLTALVIMIPCAVSAETPKHRHDWYDDIASSTETTNVYYCKDCGRTKNEDVASIRDYIVTLDANGGEIDTPKLTTKDGRIKLPLPYRNSDYQFDGWFTEKIGGEEVLSKWVHGEDTTIYAHWTIVGERTLTFASDGGSYIKPITEKHGTTINLETYIPTKDGYIFEGWFSDPREKQEQVREFAFYENGVVYARWINTDESYRPSLDFKVDAIYLTDDQIAERNAVRRGRMLEILSYLMQYYK